MYISPKQGSALARPVGVLTCLVEHSRLPSRMKTLFGVHAQVSLFFTESYCLLWEGARGKKSMLWTQDIISQKLKRCCMQTIFLGARREVPRRKSLDTGHAFRKLFFPIVDTNTGAAFQ